MSGVSSSHFVFCSFATHRPIYNGDMCFSFMKWEDTGNSPYIPFTVLFPLLSLLNAKVQSSYLKAHVPRHEVKMSVKNDIKTPNGNEIKATCSYATVQNFKMRHQVDNFIVAYCRFDFFSFIEFILQARKAVLFLN